MNAVKGDDKHIRRILVFRIGNLGDALVALPAFSALREAFPSAHIALLTNTGGRNTNHLTARSALPDDGLFDEYIEYPANAPRSLSALGRLIFRLRRGRFDAVVYMMTRNRLPRQVERDVWFFRLSGIARIHGLRHLLANRLDFGIARPLPAVRSEAEFLLDCLASEGLIDGAVRAGLARPVFGPQDLSSADSWLTENCLEASASDRLIAVAPGSKWESKIWPEDRFRRVVSELIEKAGVFPVVFGGAEDAERGDRLIADWKTGANAAGRLTVKEAAAALGRCRLYLGNDTGTMHLAASAGTRCVAIFAAVDFEGRWHPLGEGHRVFRHSVPCEGCSSPDCRNDRLCLDMVSEDAVLESCLSILAGGSTGAARSRPGGGGI